MNQIPEPRLLKGVQAEFQRAVYPGANESGIRCLGKNVLVLMDLCSDTTSGFVALPPELVERMNIASETGVLVACGNESFAYYDDGTKWTDYKPVPGDRVFVERYAGREVMGRDGRRYRLMSYSCVGGVEEPEIPAKKPAKAKR